MLLNKIASTMINSLFYVTLSHSCCFGILILKIIAKVRGFTLVWGVIKKDCRVNFKVDLLHGSFVD